MVGCKERPKITNSHTDGITQKDGSFERVFSDGDYNFQLEYISKLDTSFLDVSYKGKKVSRYGYKGKVKNDFLADLNKDKKNEVYLVVDYKRSSTLIGYTFEEGRPIKIKKEERKNLTKAGLSSFKLEQNQLVERYSSLSKEGNTEDNVSKYNLVKREGELELLPQGWQPFELEEMTGQYVSRDDTGSGYYKVLVMSKVGNEKWEVDIKMKRSNDKKIICHFNGIGEFSDRDFFVPLDQMDPNLKGTLQIRFLDLLAVVYTEQKEDYKEMTSFCKGIGSIAGNFKKTDI